MKSLNVLSLALLLQFPLSHAGFNGYENVDYTRQAAIGSLSAVSGVGLTVMLAGGRKIYKAALNNVTARTQPLAELPISQQPLINDQPDNQGYATYHEIKKGMFMIGGGLTIMVTGVGLILANESKARSNCCNALPSNSTCDWNK
jgi:hypothetical protein